MQVHLILRQSSTQQMLQGSVRQLSLAAAEYMADTQTSTVKSQVCLASVTRLHTKLPTYIVHSVR